MSDNNKNKFVRFIDAIIHDFTPGGAIDNLDKTVGPELALSPFGPEYEIAKTAILAVQQVAGAMAKAKFTYTSEQKLALANTIAQPGLIPILATKGITDDADTHASNFVQNTYNTLAGPVALTKPPAV